MDIAGYLAAVLIGVSLGLIGGGGSILTVPVLVYLFRIDAMLATTYSLFIVGISSIAGSVSYFRKGLVSVRTALLFGIPSIVAVLITRVLILPIIPPEIHFFGNTGLSREILLLVLFALLMLLASFSMIRKSGGQMQEDPSPRTSLPIIFSRGLGVGFVTGLVGAGGGFLIIPVLVNMIRIPMKMAVGTSLFIISVNSLLGFSASLKNADIDWTFLIIISLIAITGILAGSYLATKIDGKKLKPAFGWFVLVMGIYIIIRETVMKG